MRTAQIRLGAEQRPCLSGPAVGQAELIDNDHLTAQTAVDFIEPDGTIIPDVEGGPFSGTRLKVEPAP